MFPGWVPFKIVSDSPAHHSRWLLLLKIEISSIVHCCFSVSQNELKFQLQLHGKEQFNIYSCFSVKFFFQPIYTDYANQAYFDKRSYFKSSPLKPLNQIKPNLAGWVPFKIVSVSAVLYPRWPPHYLKQKFLQMAKIAPF